MIKKSTIIFFAFVTFLIAGYFFYATHLEKNDDFVSYQVDVKNQNLKMFWRDKNGERFKSIANLKSQLNNEGQQLVFAMNGGMFKKDYSPQGLFIEEQKTIAPLDTTSSGGNFYLKPNGVFYITTDRKAIICKTDEFINNGKINYATQSGPMLLVNGKIHPAFNRSSKNLNIRNGVGILPGNKVLFAMSKKEISFYDFASYFKRLGCNDALYLDGLVSRTYLPPVSLQTDGDFGVIIGVTSSQQ